MPEIKLKNGMIPLRDGVICTSGCCGPPPCEPPCQPGRTPRRFLLDVAGLCAELDGRYMLWAVLTSTGEYTCLWRYADEDEPAVTWELEFAYADGAWWLVARLDVDGQYQSVWESQIASYTPLDCCEDLNESTFALVSEEGDFCDASGATLALTAICPIEPACAGFCPDGIPERIAVTIPAFAANPSHWCTPDFCHLMQGTYILTLFSQTTDTCIWAAPSVYGACGGLSHWATVNLLVLNTGAVRVVVTFDGHLLGALYHYLWEDSIAEESCLFDERVLPFLAGHSANTPTSPCVPVDGSASEVTISAI